MKNNNISSKNKKCAKLVVVIKMEKKFKEYRMFLVCLSLFVIFVSLSIYCLLLQHKPQALGAGLLSLIALFLLILRYNMVLFDDMMMIYEWKVAAMLPTLIEYKDIKKIYAKSAHHVVIEHGNKSHIYVFNSKEFINTYEKICKVEGE